MCIETSVVLDSISRVVFETKERLESFGFRVYLVRRSVIQVESGECYSLGTIHPDILLGELVQRYGELSRGSVYVSIYLCERLSSVHLGCILGCVICTNYDPDSICFIKEGKSWKVEV